MAFWGSHFWGSCFEKYRRRSGILEILSGQKWPLFGSILDPLWTLSGHYLDPILDQFLTPFWDTLLFKKHAKNVGKVAKRGSKKWVQKWPQNGSFFRFRPDFSRKVVKKWSFWPQNDPKMTPFLIPLLSKTVRQSFGEIAKIGSKKWVQKGPKNGQKWSKMVKNGQKWGHFWRVIFDP